MYKLRMREIAVAFLLLTASCKGQEEEYVEPHADAGESQTLDLGQTVTLDGSGSEVCCEKVIAYQWYFKQVPLESAVDDAVFGTSNGSAEAQTVQWVPDVPGAYVIGLIVSDDVLTSSEDITVIEMAKSNELPLADAGDDQVGVVDQMVEFDGTESSDEKGVQLEYEWILASIPDGSGLTDTDIFDADQPTASIVPDVAGSFVLGLRVYDKTDWSIPDYTTARIASDNQAPVANAGEGFSVPPCESAAFPLNGLASYDPEGGELQYDWTIKEIPEGSAATTENLDDKTSATPVFSPDVFPGDYSFWLQVSDGESWSAYDAVTFSVSNAEANQAPVASITTDTTVSITTDCPYVSGKRTCKPCLPKLELDASASSDPDGHELSVRWTSEDGTFDYFDQSETEFLGEEFTGSYGSSSSHTYNVTLEVSDCDKSSSQTVSIDVTCTGVAP